MRLDNGLAGHTAAKLIFQRELGYKSPLGFRDQIYRKIYSSLFPFGYWDHENSEQIKAGNGSHGGVFNLEYSPDGSKLLAACEQKSFIVLDPVTRKDVHYVRNAHLDCVNCVRFLDTRTFATCSDDTTVALWDIRNLKQKVRMLRGHSNWVKNIEYVRDEGLLVTSGFDGCVYTWDINSYTEEGLMSQRVFHSNGLMRMRLTPDCSKMILCTAGGYIMVVHNLNLFTLSQDLAGFKPNMYRLMQISQTPISLATNFSHLFKSKRNRIELISDWPAGNEAEVISALHVHPFGWCVVSRNTSNLDKSEWTCVHDIQDVPIESPVTQRKRPRLDSETNPPSTSYHVFSSSSSSSNSSDEEVQPTSNTNASITSSQQVEVRITAPLQWTALPGERAGFHLQLNSNTPISSTENFEVRIPGEEMLEALANIRRARSRESSENPQEYRTHSRTLRRQSSQTNSPSSSQESPFSDQVAWDDSENPNLTAHFVRAVADLAARSVHLLDPFRLRSRHGARRHPPSLTYDGDSREESDMNIHPNLHRITHYIQEPNVGRGYIKELCFSPDGRVIGSPFGNGVRLLTFNEQCADMSFGLSSQSIMGTDCYGANRSPASTLHELSTNGGHSDVVVTTKFSPTHPVFVSGCLGGKIVWHQPQL